jgi:GT2 family glycosyltransferase
LTTTAVIGNYNGDAHLEECISTLREQTDPPTSIVVVDGSSTDGSAELASRLDTRLIRRPNLGLGHLYNTGVAASTADFVFLANNDIALAPTCLEHLNDALANRPAAFAADARQQSWDGARTIHARTVLTRGRLLGEYLPGLHLDANVPATFVAPSVCANGAAMLVRRSMFNELGGFDETFFLEWEDLDLCWRAWVRGWGTVYVPDAVVRHRVGAATSSDAQPKRAASSHHNLMRFALKCLPPREAVRVLAGELLRLPVHPRAITRGAWTVLRELREVRRHRLAAAPAQQVLDSLLEETPTSVPGAGRALR